VWAGCDIDGHTICPEPYLESLFQRYDGPLLASLTCLVTRPLGSGFQWYSFLYFLESPMLLPTTGPLLTLCYPNSAFQFQLCGMSLGPDVRNRLKSLQNTFWTLNTFGV
jgi:hypothetical protein